MTMLAKVAAPLVWLLDSPAAPCSGCSASTAKARDKVTDEEIKMLVAEAEHTA